MKSYIEILAEVAQECHESENEITRNCTNGGGTNVEWSIARCKFLAEIVRETIPSAKEEEIGAFKTKVWELLAEAKNHNLFPTNSSANRQALEEYRRGDSPKSGKATPPSLL